MVATMAFSTSLSLPSCSRTTDFFSRSTNRQSTRLVASALPNLHGLSSRTDGLNLKINEQSGRLISASQGPIEARNSNPPVVPAIMTPEGPMDLSSLLLRNRIIFIGQAINGQVAQRVISQLITLATIDEDSDIMIYLNSPGGSTYSVFAIYDCMCWIKPKVGTVCFGMVGNQSVILLAGGEKGMRYSMPSARVLLNQPDSSCGGNALKVRAQVDEAIQSRHKMDMMYSIFTGQSIETIQMNTDRNRFFTPAEAMDFGLIDGLLETKL